jgi:hypothetical protein
MKNTYQYNAGLQKSTGEIIYSRARHDFYETTDQTGYVDGGAHYFRGSGVEPIVIELSLSPAELYNDWNHRIDLYGRIDTNRLKDYPEFIRVVPNEEVENQEDFEYKKKYATWNTYGKDGLGIRKQVMLTDCDTDHLEAILDTQNHIGGNVGNMIHSILSDRNS